MFSYNTWKKLPTTFFFNLKNVLRPFSAKKGHKIFYFASPSICQKEKRFFFPLLVFFSYIKQEFLYLLFRGCFETVEAEVDIKHSLDVEGSHMLFRVFFCLLRQKCILSLGRIYAPWVSITALASLVRKDNPRG